MYQDSSGSAGSSLTGDREDDLQSIDSLNEDQHAQNVKASEKLPESDFSNASLAKELPQQSQTWADAEDKDEKQATVKSYCPWCRVDSHSEAECFASLIRQANNKRKNPDAEDSKPGKSVRKKKSFKRFKHDIAQVAVEGRNTDDLQYVMEIDDNSHLFACYLLSIFGDFTEGHSSEGHSMAGNADVMELSARFSSEGMNKTAAEEHWMMVFEHV